MACYGGVSFSKYLWDIGSENHARGRAKKEWKHAAKLVGASFLMQDAILHASVTPPTPEFTVYGKLECPFTQLALQTLGNRTAFHVVKTAKDAGVPQHTPKSHTTVPVIFHHNRFVGGYTDLTNYLARLPLELPPGSGAAGKAART